jgi:hypothetical protein
MSEHSRLSPSSMARILVCPGSAIDNPRDTGGPAAEEGTYVHSLCERILNGETLYEGDYHNEEMKAAVFTFVSYVRAFQNEFSPNSETHIEVRLVSEETPDHGGTLDVGIVSDKHLHVIDLKYGLKPVNPKNNKQILSYLTLLDEKYPGRERFFGTIVQPRVFGSSPAVEYTADQISCHALDVLLIVNDDSKTASEHCQYCPLAQECEVLTAYARKVAIVDFDDEWNAEQCQEAISMATVFKTLSEKAHDRIADLLQSGVEVPGWKLVTQLANKAWTSEEVVINLLKEKGLSDEVIYTRKLVSPAQLKKFSKAYIPVIEANVERKAKGIIAVTECNNKFPEFVPNPESAFSDL